MYATLWKLILPGAIRVVFAVVGLAVGAMLLAMVREIVRFTALSQDLWLTVRFVALQVPYLLPYTLPLAALAAGFIVMRHLSLHHETTALRASGYSMAAMIQPLLGLGCMLSLMNLLIVSELGPRSRLQAKLLFEEVARTHPLAILPQARLLSLPRFWSQAHKLDAEGATDLWILGARNKDSPSALAHFDRVEPREGGMVLEGVTVVQPGSLEEEEQTMWVEQAEEISVPTALLAEQLLQSPLQDARDYAGGRSFMRRALSGEALAWQEIWRRLSLGCAPVVCICFGALYGFAFGRSPPRATACVAALGAILYLLGSVVGKVLPPRPLLYLPCFFLPLALLLPLSMLRAHRIAEGRVGS